MPAEGERKNLITTDQWYLGRVTNAPLHLRLLALITARGEGEVHHHATDALWEISRGLTDLETYLEANAGPP
jgi:hypothetical protein